MTRDEIIKMAQEAGVNTEPDNGGPAFPHPAGWRRDPEISDGMSLRDYFAAKALQGICASGPGEHMTSPAIAREAYDLAEAMLIERLKWQP